MELHSTHLPRGALLPLHLTSFFVSGQLHLADTTLAPLVQLISLALDTCGNLTHAPGGDAPYLTPAAFLGLSQLEVFEVTRATFGDANPILAVLNGFGKLRRLTGNLALVPSLLTGLSRCPLVELKLQPNVTDKAACALPSPMAFAREFPQLQSLSVAMTRAEYYAVWEQTKDIKGIAASFSKLQGLRVSAIGFNRPSCGPTTLRSFAPVFAPDPRRV